jgi:hypothetical protein
MFVDCLDLSDFWQFCPILRRAPKVIRIKIRHYELAFLLPIEILEASHGDVGSVMKQGDKIKISKTIRSQQTGLLLPKEGIILGI